LTHKNYKTFLTRSKLAGLEKVPAIIREGEQTDLEKLELAILENLQREDLNPVDKARSFNRLVAEFGHTHAQVAESLGKSREYVSNSLRLLQLPDDILDALSAGKISEGHTRPLLMLKERPDEQQTLFMQMTSIQGMTVRDAEKFARSIATEKQRKNKDLDPEMKEIQQKLASHLGTKVSIDKKSQGGKLTIEFGNRDDLRQLFEKIQAETQVVTQQVAEPAVVASTADIGLDQFSAQTGQVDIEHVAPAYSQDPVRTTVVEQVQPTVVSDEISDLQKEIYSLADSAKPDTFTEESQSQYSYRQAVAQKQEVEIEINTEKEDKFAFHDQVEFPSTEPASPFVDVVSDNAFDTFAKMEYPDPVENVQSVSMGNEFVPEHTIPVEPAPNPEVAPQQWGSMTSNTVNDEPSIPEDTDLYRLDDFSV